MGLQLRNTAGLAVLVAIAWACFLIGKTFSTGLTIFAIVVWCIAMGMFVYAVLFRGVKFRMRRRADEDGSNAVAVGLDVETPESGYAPRFENEDGKDR